MRQTESVNIEVKESSKSSFSVSKDVEGTIAPTDAGLPVKEDEEFDSAQFDKYLEKVEEGWKLKMESVFLEGSAGSSQKLREYLKLKKGYEQEREKRYEAFHKMMEEKHGSNYSYSPSEDEEMFNEKLVKIYESNLAKIVGKGKMVEYLKAKDSFNQKLEDESTDNTSYILIEF